MNRNTKPRANVVYKKGRKQYVPVAVKKKQGRKPKVAPPPADAPKK
jgi:hypothetical protein